MRISRWQLAWQIFSAGLRARIARRPRRLAIIAGAGELPRLAAEHARGLGIHLVIYHVSEAELDAVLAADPQLEKRQVSLGNISQTLKYLEQDQITEVILLGKVEKQRFLQDVNRDAVADALYRAAADRRDDTLFQQFAALLRAMGVNILKQRELLPQCFLTPGVHTQKRPESAALLADIEFGYEISRNVGSLDIGQTAVVFEKMILAVEAIEGTDAAIRRAGEIAQSRGGVVCKTGKASQDPRFDLPAVGLRTLETMKQAGMQCLVIEATQTLVVNPKEFVARADELGLIVMAR